MKTKLFALSLFILSIVVLGAFGARGADSRAFTDDTEQLISVVDSSPDGRNSGVPPELHLAATTRTSGFAEVKMDLFAQKIDADPKRKLNSLSISVVAVSPPKGMGLKETEPRFITAVFAINGLRLSN